MKKINNLLFAFVVLMIFFSCGCRNESAPVATPAVAEVKADSVVPANPPANNRNSVNVSA